MTEYLLRKNKLKKNTIFYTDTTSTGGAEVYLNILALNLINEFNIRVAIPKNKGTEHFVNELRSKGVKIDYINKYNFIGTLLYFRKNKPDYIHFNLPYPTKCMISILAGIVYCRAKLYVTEHLVPPEYKPNSFTKLIKKFLYSKLDLSITVSNKNKEALIKNFDLPENKIKVIYNCIDIDQTNNYDKEKVKNLRKKFSINDSALVFGTIGRLNRQKGHEYLINASKEVIEKVPNSIFLVVGRGKLKNQLIQKINKNNIGENFKMVGYQENLPEMLSLIDIFVLPSISEGFPFSILEAMAAKKPVISANVGGVPEIITNNVNGILVKPKDSDALARAMILLAKNEEKRNLLAEMGHKKVIENFSLEIMIAKTKEIYK